MFNVSDKIKLNEELCPVDKREQKHFQFGVLNYPALILDWEMEVMEAFTDSYHGPMVAVNVLNDDRVEAGTLVYFRVADCILSKETKLKIDFEILGKQFKNQPLIDLNRGTYEELKKARVEMKKSLSIKDPVLQANWAEIKKIDAEYKKLQENTETVFIVKTPKYGTFELDCPEDKLEQTIRREMRKSRAEAKKITPVVKTIAGNINYEKIGGVLSKAGKIAEISKDFAIKIIDEHKKPTTKEDNYVGIELECFGPLSIKAMKEEFIKAGLKKWVNVGTDGSIRPEDDTHAMEIRVCIAEKDLVTILPKVFAVIENADMSTNASCGTHVHLDMRNRDAELAYSNLFRVQKLMLASQPKGRRTNSYCKKNTVSDLKLSDFDSVERYSVINPTSFKKHSTIEIRLHAGTVKYEDMKAWTEFLVTIVDLKSKLVKEVETLEQLSELSVNLSEETSKHITKRIKKYA